MAAKNDNQYWKLRKTHGRKTIYQPNELWDIAVEYFDWVIENPLIEEKVFHNNGIITVGKLNKMRAMTESGFCLFAEISNRTFTEYCKNQDFMPITTRIKEIIKTTKFEGAAAELLNPNIIARDLGLVDKKELEHKEVLTNIINLGEGENPENGTS